MKYTEEEIAEIVRKANDLIGKEAFLRLHEGLTADEWNKLNDFIARNGKCLHCDGYLGFTNEYPDGTWSNEGFEL